MREIWLCVSKKLFNLYHESPLIQRAFFISKGNEMELLAQLKSLQSKEMIVSGITEKEELIQAFEAGATYAGLIFVLTSPFGIDIEKAKMISENSPLPFIGIFQNSDLADVVHIVNEVKLSAVVLNGWETQKFIDQLRLAIPKEIKIIKIAHLCDDAPKMNYQNVDFYLLGGHVGEKIEPNLALLKQMDLSKVFLSGNWKNSELFASISTRPLGVELNVKM